MRRSAPLLLLAAALALGGCGLTESLVADVLYTEAELPAENVRRDVPYRTTGDPKHRLDLFLPLADSVRARPGPVVVFVHGGRNSCLLYTSPSPRDRQKSRMPSSA